LIDDNGDGLGTPRLVSRSSRREKSAGGAVDGVKAHQICLVPNAEERVMSPATRRERDALEKEMAALREKKPTMPSEKILRGTRNILQKLATIYLGPIQSAKPESSAET